MNELRDGFFEECVELLEVLDEGLSAFEDGSSDSETINAMFRAVHSIKGGAGAFGLNDLVSFAHVFENVLDDIRGGKLAIDADLLACLFRSSDYLTDLVECARDEVDHDASRGEEILVELRRYNGITDGAPESPAQSAAEPPPADDFMPMTLDLDGGLPGLDEDDVSSDTGYKVTFVPSSQLLEHGNEPLLLLRSLSELGELTTTVDASEVPALEDYDAFNPRLKWICNLKTDRPASDIEAVFEFVEGLCTLDIEGQAGADPTAPNESPSESTFEERETPSDVPPQPEPRPETVASPPSNAEKPNSKAAAKSGSRDTIRVELHRVDRLINLVGELVISEAMLRQSMSEAAMSAHGSIETAMTQLRQLSGVLQESVMAIRAQPVRGLFQRMSRIVRETAREANKSARLVTEGEATEVDKTVTERLVEPLTHMIRNAVDHGIEKEEKRKEVGKDEKGTIKLSAAHRSGRVVIELKDDGAGINRPKVRSIAIEKGLISESDELSDTEIDNLLFHPGFSTNKEVSKLSGRGVGMDVVKNEIQALGGRVTIQSEFGKGTTVSISLPLTLAVLEGMVVEAAGEILVVPTSGLRETVRANDAVVHPFGSKDKILSMREGLVPIVDLAGTLGFRSATEQCNDSSLLLVESDNGKRTALAVDKILDQREVVIKGLEQNYQQVDGVSAATILGDGRIALIVDTDQLATRLSSRSDIEFGVQQ
jgi:two-component system chemotaxis sensor kinase CheA